MKKHIQYKQFSEAETGQLDHLSFVAGGNLRRSASRTRNRLRNKQSDIHQYNFMVKLKNFCIDLENKTYNRETFLQLSEHLNLYKKPVDHIDYTLWHHDTFSRQHILKQFIQYNLPFKYLKYYHYNETLIN